ncbi:uncharacterized protein LOC123014771 [Tribolium madens]|uniref:uncharacterized protein LOC123014771 n=1 Tax=Tribolium madens TaxID=41895 RepID=UPI001CF72A3E|nr:uncharacterized protein LOC123014771 [Tribolium madens]XP_044269973.1 uncharacterized protein LOC123014771 [Tribolium madens]
MAFQHAALFFTLIFLWLLLTNAQGRRDAKYPQVRTPQQRLTRGIEALKYHNMDLGTARGYGKRAVDMHNVNNFLLEWIALETRMRNLGIPRNLLRDQETIPE